MSLPPEILKKVKLLEIAVRKKVNSTFSGQYQSAFKGQGMTFSEFREYVPGDDVRTISWSVTARTGKPHIKKFDEERELILMLVVDISGSTTFGSGQYAEGEVITYLSALLGFTAAKNNDHVGLLLFSDQIEHFVPPKKGRAHVQRILRDLFYFKPRSQRTKISVATDYLQGILKKRANVFIFSDFMDDSFASALRTMGRKHDTVAVVVQDPLELEFPKMGLIEVEDFETGEMIAVDTSSRTFQQSYKSQVQSSRAARDRELQRSQIDRVDVVSGEDFFDPLIDFFRRRPR